MAKKYRKLFRHKFLCGILGWHKPTKTISVRGINLESTCKYCGKFIMQDSQGNWFESVFQERRTDGEEVH